MALTILYIVLAICAAVLTGYLSYTLYNLTQTLKEARKTTKNANKQLEKIDRMTDSIEDAVTSVSQTVKTASDALSKPLDGAIHGIRMAQAFIEKMREGRAPKNEPKNDSEE